MQAYKTKTIIQDKQRLVLENVPFLQGQHVEVVILADNNANEHARRLAELKALFADTQSLPQIQEISEEEIAVEIAAHRAGK